LKISTLLRFAFFGISTIVLKRQKAILGTIILTDKCNLSCKHCSVANKTEEIHPYEQIKAEMKQLFKMGIRILFFSGGETFLWSDSGKTVRDLVCEAKEIGFLIVNVVTSGTYRLDLPEADLILLSIDGGRERHNEIRGDTYDAIMQNIIEATATNICFYMAINKINKDDIEQVCETAKRMQNVKAVSFNFHTPYPETSYLQLDVQEKEECCDAISRMIHKGYPIFNLESAFPHIVHNTFPRPCRQCVVMENGILSVCGRCVNIRGLCQKCGYFFAAEYALMFEGNLNVIREMLSVYLKYV
jgi:MoaA/NifB/PqqE/SkfB family radical SAM enzyme